MSGIGLAQHLDHYEGPTSLGVAAARTLVGDQWLDEFVGKTTANPESEPTIAETIQRAHRPKASQSLVEGKHINFDYLD